MSVGTRYHDWLVELRRDLHQRPEPAWREFYTTARIVDEIEAIGVDELYVGPEMLASDARLAVPDDAALEDWADRARAAGVDDDLLDRMAGGHTGAIAVLDRGEGPTVALRVDIDGLVREESTSDTHHPAAEGFRSRNEGAMHACGHDAHAAIGLGVLRALAESDFSGTFKLIAQPAEEQIGGGKAIAESGHLDDVDTLLAVHVGLDHPTGEVVAGVDGFLAVRHLDATFSGEGAHAGGHPGQGRNAVQAMATAVQNLYAIPRHGDGSTRVNAGRVGGGTASNIVPESAFIEGEVRGETTELMEYMWDEANRVIEHAAEMHDCAYTITRGGEAPSATSDVAVVDRVATAARDVAGVDTVRRRDDLGGSEDATFLMRRVQERGGEAGYVCIGTDHPGGHHTATFDVDERSLPIGVDVLSNAVLSAFADGRTNGK
ncbi:amidohydrolase [Salinibaculum rarum]|uniref:amidohydrolase n=1 Tax=Salinibaculum rarum TaxID=3058903 RepID=UPI00265F17DB|nr:amidohydrolase [Salinibaculum sp. KK48]